MSIQFRNSLAVLAVIATVLAVGARAQTPAPAPAAMGSSSLSKADQRIVTDMAQANMAEVALAKVAQSKSQSDQVKQFAQQMIDDHGKALADVQQLAQSKGVTLPAAPTRAQQAEADKLAKTSAAKFDSAYLKQAGVVDHQKVHTMLQKVASKAKDADVKALGAKMMPTVDQHLARAQQLAGGSGKSATGSAGTTGTSGTSGTSGSSGGAGTSGASGTPADPSASPGASSTPDTSGKADPSNSNGPRSTTNKTGSPIATPTVK
jgi:putative membrane protein